MENTAKSDVLYWSFDIITLFYMTIQILFTEILNSYFIKIVKAEH